MQIIHNIGMITLVILKALAKKHLKCPLNEVLNQFDIDIIIFVLFEFDGDRADTDIWERKLIIYLCFLGNIKTIYNTLTL